MVAAGSCAGCRNDDRSAFFRTVLTFDNSLLLIPFPLSSLPSPGVRSSLDVVMLVSCVVQYGWS